MERKIPKNLRAAQLRAVLLCGFLWVQPAYSTGEPSDWGNIRGTKWDVTIISKVRDVLFRSSGTVTFFATEAFEGSGEIRWFGGNSYPFNFVEKTLPGGLTLFRGYHMTDVTDMMGWGVCVTGVGISMTTFVWYRGLRPLHIIFGVPYVEALE